MEENQHHLQIACETCKSNSVVSNLFLISFLKLFGVSNLFIVTGMISQILGPN